MTVRQSVALLLLWIGIAMYAVTILVGSGWVLHGSLDSDHQARLPAPMPDDQL